MKNLKVNRKNKIILHLIPSLNPFGGTPKKILWQHQNSFFHHSVWNRKIFENKKVHEKGKELFKKHGVLVGAVKNERNLYSIARSLYLLIKKLKPSVIQCYFDGDIILIPFIKYLFPGIPVVVSFVGPFSSKSAVKNFFVKRGLIRADYFVFNSFYTKREKERDFNLLKERNSQIIYNGYSDAKTKRIKNNNINKNLINLISVGGLVEWKNHIFLINIINRLVHEENIKNVKLKIIGDGPLFNEFDNLIKKYKLEDFIYLLGYQEDIEAYYLEADIYLHPALKEAFGIAVIEAMSYSLPVLLANRGAFPELITNGNEGFLIDPDNIDKWIVKLKKLICNPHLRNQIGTNAKNTVEDKFSLDKFVKSFDDLYESLVRSK